MNNNIEAQLMAKEIRRYIVERRDKKELALLKEKPNKGKGGINVRLFVLTKKLLGNSDEQIKNYKNKNKTLIELKYQSQKFIKLLQLLETNNIDINAIKQEYDSFLSKNTGDSDKKKLSLLKNKPKKDKSGKEKGGLNQRLIKFAGDSLGTETYEVELLRFDYKTKIDLEFEFSNYEFLISILDEYKLDNRVLDVISEYKETLSAINQDHKVNIWLNQWANKARDISFATHIAKLTHSSSRSSSIYDDNNAVKEGYLTTSTLSEKLIDITGNAGSAPAGEILTLQVHGKSLLDYVKANDNKPFQSLTDDDNEVSEWMKGFKQAYDSDKKQSHFLSKQIYFPVGQEKYHLLMPLVSSSLAHTLFLKFKEYSGDENDLIWTQRKNKKFHNNLSVSYPNKAYLTLTRSLKAHLNVSQLNKDRNGRHTLLTCMPPQWTGKQKIANQLNNLFNRSLSNQLRGEIKTLQRLLLIIKSKEIAMKKPDMHRAIVRAVNDIADGLFDELNMINLLSEEKGWTKESSLPIAQQLLLEPNRDDDIAIQEKLKKQWQANIANDFAYWLNRQLKHKKLKLTPIQQRLWQDIFSEKCRQYIAEQEATL